MQIDTSRMSLNQVVASRAVDWDSRIEDIRQAIPRVTDAVEREALGMGFAFAVPLMHNRDFLWTARIHSALCNANMKLPGTPAQW